MSSLTPAGSSARQPYQPHDLAQSLGAAIVLEPEAGFVTLGRHRIPARRISDDWDLRGQSIHFEVNGKSRYYRITIYDNRAEVITEVSRWHEDGSPMYYHGEDHEYVGLKAFILFVITKLLPDLP